MIKVVAPRMCLNVVDRAIQVTITHYTLTCCDPATDLRLMAGAASTLTSPWVSSTPGPGP